MTDAICFIIAVLFIGLNIYALILFVEGVIHAFV